MVSESDLHLVAGRKWHTVRTKYSAYAATWNGGKSMYMHRVLTGVADKGREVFVDHIDYNGLNNTRGNLRLCTPAENTRNRRTAKTYLGLRGVSPHADCFIAQIGCEGKFIYLGSYPTEREAGIAYDAAAAVLFGKHSPVRRT